MTSSTAAENLFVFLFPWRRRRLTDQLGGEAARQCRSILWHRICQRTRNMSAPEIRGYARAQAADVLAAEVERVLDRRYVNSILRDRALAAAVEQLVGMAVRDVLGEPLPKADTIAA